MIASNDPKRPEFPLEVSGLVSEFAKIEPRLVRLAGKAGEPIATSVTITPVQSFKILEANAEPGVNVRASLSPGKAGAYLLSVENIGTVNLNYSEKVVLRTDHPERPEISIMVVGKLQP